MKHLLVTTLAVAGLALAGCGSSGGGSASGGSSSGSSTTGTNAVAIKNYSFNPGTVTIKAGTTVTWTMDDGGTTHNVVDSAQGIKSPDLKQGNTFSYTFKTPGTYNYICSYHQYMKGTITVQ